MSLRFGEFVGELAGGRREQEIGQDEERRRDRDDHLDVARTLGAAIGDLDDERVLQKVVVERAEELRDEHARKALTKKKPKL